MDLEAFARIPLIREIIRRIPTIVGGLGTILGGIYVLMHDSRDFGKFTHDGTKGGVREYLHHWYWGLAMILLGLITIASVFIDLYLSLVESSPHSQYQPQIQQASQQPYTA